MDRQPASASKEGPPPKAQRFLDTKAPVGFPVALASGVEKGIHPVKGTVVYFYCSQREGWCRKGSAEISFNVDVP